MNQSTQFLHSGFAKLVSFVKKLSCERTPTYTNKFRHAKGTCTRRDVFVKELMMFRWRMIRHFGLILLFESLVFPHNRPSTTLTRCSRMFCINSQTTEDFRCTGNGIVVRVGSKRSSSLRVFRLPSLLTLTYCEILAIP